MKTRMSAIIVAIGMAVALTTFNLNAQTPVPVNGGGSTNSWLSLSTVDPDGFPVQFSLSPDAFTTYAWENVTQGYIDLYGQKVLSATGQKRYATVQGSAEDVLKRLSTTVLNFKVASPTNSYVNFSGSMQGSDYNELFSGGNSFKLTRSGGTWSVGTNDQKLALRLNAGDLHITFPPAVDSIRVVPSADKNGNVGLVKYINRDRNGKFVFDLYTLPQVGVVIATTYTDAGVVEKAYDIQSGNPNEVAVTQGFTIGVEGMSVYSDADLSATDSISVVGSAPQWAQSSPTISLTLTSSRLVNTWGVLLDSSNTPVEGALTASYRKAGTLEWSTPEAVNTAGILQKVLSAGHWFIRFPNWPKSFQPSNPSQYNGDDGGGGGSGYSTTTGEPIQAIPVEK